MGCEKAGDVVELVGDAQIDFGKVMLLCWFYLVQHKLLVLVQFGGYWKL